MHEDVRHGNQTVTAKLVSITTNSNQLRGSVLFIPAQVHLAFRVIMLLQGSITMPVAHLGLVTVLLIMELHVHSAMAIDSLTLRLFTIFAILTIAKIKIYSAVDQNAILILHQLLLSLKVALL